MKLADLLEEFNIVINTSEGLNELRSLILGLAVRGKLVPQDTSDEPASELLKKIEAEKHRLYEDGEIRKPKKLKNVSDNEIPFEIPRNWIWTKLGETANDVHYGYTESADFDIPEPKFLRITDIQNGKVDWENTPGCTIEEDDISKYQLHNGDLLIARTGGTVGKSFLINDVEYSAVFASYLIRFIPTFTDTSEYIYKYLYTKLYWDQLYESTSGTGQPNVNATKLSNLLFPLPPLAEQHRIVQKVESLFAEVDELEAKLNRQAKLDKKLQVAVNAEVQQAPDTQASKTAWNFITFNFNTFYHTPEAIDNLKKNILNEAVRGRLVPQNPNDEPASELLKKIEAEKQRLYEEGEIRKPKKLPPVKEDEVPFEIPESWEWVKFNKVSDFINGDRGKNYPNKSEYVDEGVAWINTGHIEPDGTLTTVDMNYITEEKYNSLRSGKIKKTDLVYCLRGATFGKTSFVTPYEKGAIASSLMIIRPFIEEMNHFIFQYLVSPVGRRQLFRFDNGSAQPNLSATSVRKYQFPLPPLEEQHRIVRRIEELFAICDRFKAQLEQREKVNERLVKGLVREVLGGAGSDEKEISMAAEPKSDSQIPKKSTNIDYYRRTVLAAEIVWQLYQEPTLGHVKLQKLIYLVQETSGMMLPTNFLKKAAGPYDRHMARSIDKQLQQKKWFEFQKGKYLKYKPLEKAGEHKADFDKYFLEEKENIQFLIDIFKKAKTEQVEIVATLYACWKELIENDKSVTDNLLIDQFYSWSEEKAKFKQSRLVKAINWMRDKGVMPVS